MNFSTCAYMQIFNFRDGHVTTFRHPSGAYICQIPGRRLSRLARRTPSRVSAFHRYHWFWGKTVSCSLVCRTVEGYPKNAKNAFWISLRPRYKIPEYFTIAPVFTATLTVCRRNRGDPSSLGFRVRYDYRKNIAVLVWPGAAHTPIAV